MRGAPEIDAREAAALGDGAVLLDVREGEEWSAGHAPHAVHVPLADLPDALLDLEVHRRVVCVCRTGIRSATAAAFLLARGFDAVNLAGGLKAWEREGFEVVDDHGRPGSVV